MRHYTIAEARFILSHVYCVHHVPEGDGGTYAWAPGAGEPLCCRCTCSDIPDLRLYVVSVAEASVWLKKENAFIDRHNASLNDEKPGHPSRDDRAFQSARTS